MRLAGAGITLHEQTRGEKLLKIKHGLLATAKAPLPRQNRFQQQHPCRYRPASRLLD
ncbi:hypothetical protein HED55_01130 [Ochrobactrum haematophilum]|uniref:Uncharacterized protein n=1 Tax=Brucella haematophila TaxID=419474 RepID=A0ABX1DKH2_9HYPH|nr:hypothetical protein [Brucella haematophila]